jgi:hypothetical protein
LPRVAQSSITGLRYIKAPTTVPNAISFESDGCYLLHCCVGLLLKRAHLEVRSGRTSSWSSGIWFNRLSCAGSNAVFHRFAFRVRLCSSRSQACGRHVTLSHARPRLNLIVRPRLSLSPSLRLSLSPNLKPCSNLKPSPRFNLGLSLHGIRRRHGRICLMGVW